jgi:CHAT domain-containing protein
VKLFSIVVIIISTIQTLSLQGSKLRVYPINDQLDQLNKKVIQLVNAGDYLPAIPLLQEAAEIAKSKHLDTYRVGFLNYLSNCQFTTYQFQAALRTMTEGRGVARQSGIPGFLAIFDGNMSSLFLQMGNLSEAAAAAEEGYRYRSVLAPKREALLLGQLGTIRAKLGHLDTAEPVFAEAIEIAARAKNAASEAWIWDSLAYARMREGKLSEAEAAVYRSLELRKLPDVGGIDGSYMILGEIRARQNDPQSALSLLDQAEKALSLPRSVTPPWWIYMRRGKVKMQMGDLKSALSDLNMALQSVREWRADVPANDANRTSSETELAELYQLLTETGNRLYLKTHDPRLLRETFEVAEENRAASLRALLPQQNDWRKRLPLTYYELLSKLQALQIAQLRHSASNHTVALAEIRSKMSEIEAGLGGSQPQREDQALHRAQQALDRNSVLFSFQVGETDSWMWAVTRNTITLHTLPPESELRTRIIQFQRAAGSDSKGLENLSASLYRSLFGTVEPQLLAAPHWLLTLDGPLFDLPFPALSSSPGKYLIEDHSLQIAPSALMLQPASAAPSSHGGFLAVGDPIYNLADPRAHTGTQWRIPFSLLRASYQEGPAFARLWGTAKEIEVSRRAWNAPSSVLLTGEQAVPEIFWTQTANKPDIIHIATHILEENEKPQTGWIAFSLDHDAQVQYITPEDILAKSISARLVVLSGCSSGKADIQPATGLMGLTRAWIGAGAGAVLATRWPTIDDDGAFFESFYRHLRQSNLVDPAVALQKASIEMLRSGNWRANPSFWAGYFLIGNY